MINGDPLINPQAAKILIVEDESDLAQMLHFTLRKGGYETLAAYDGMEAWKRIQSEKPDLIILDLMLPELDGWEICRMVRREEKNEIREIGILILSARAQVEDRIHGLELGADDYLTKPFSLKS
jgi:DNA-binding response OmpR family regulator